MKKLIFATTAIAAMLAASCSNGDVQAPAAGGNVSFTVMLPEMASRADFGDGTTAKQLTYYVYDAEATGDTKTVLFDGTADFGADLHATVQLDLVTGKTYDIVFWADSYGDAATRPYTYDGATQTVTVTYGADANAEARDAFFFTEKALKVSGPVSKPVTLKRPFAQLNIGTSDFEAAEKAGLALTQTGMYIADMPNTLNLYDGTVGGSVKAEFTLAALPEGRDFPVEAAKYKYLTMNYVLVGADKTTVDVHLTSDINASADRKDVAFTAVPVQRNYRTNIFGALLTDPATFDVVIDEQFTDDPGHNHPILPEGAIRLGDNTYTTLAEAIAAVTADNNVIELGDGEYSTSDLGRLGQSATFKAAGNNVVFKMPSAVTVTVPELSFEGITLDTPNQNYTGLQHTDKVTYTGCTIKNKLFLYGTEETFNSCTFVNDGDYNVWTYGAKTASFNNCKFGSYGKAILVYNEGSTTPVINVNGCAFKATEAAVGKAAIEVDCSYNNVGDIYTININNSTSEGFDNGSVSGNPLWNVKNGDQYLVVVDGVEHRAPLAPTATGYDVSTAEGLKQLANLEAEDYAGKTIKLTADIDLTGTEWTPIKFWTPGNKVTIDGQNHTITGINAPLFSEIVGDIKNLNFKNVAFSTPKYFAGAAAGNLYGDLKNIHLDGVTIVFNCAATEASRIGSVVGIYNGGNAENVTVTNATISGPWCVGGIFGTINETANRTFTNCSISNSTVTGTYAGALVADVNVTGVRFISCSYEGCTPQKALGEDNPNVSFE